MNKTAKAAPWKAMVASSLQGAHIPGEHPPGPRGRQRQGDSPRCLRVHHGLCWGRGMGRVANHT